MVQDLHRAAACVLGCGWKLWNPFLRKTRGTHLQVCHGTGPLFTIEGGPRPVIVGLCCLALAAPTVVQPGVNSTLTVHLASSSYVWRVS